MITQPYNPVRPDKRILGMSRRGQNAYRGSTMATLNPAMPPGGQQTMFQPNPMMMPPGQRGFMAGPMGPAMPADVFPKPQAQMPAALDPRQAALSQMMGRGASGRPDPTMKAIIDSMTGARVHKGMDGKQLGMGGVDPNIKYMLYAMRGRRHKGMGGQDIY